MFNLFFPLNLFIRLNVESRFRSIGQHKCYSPVVYPNQFGQSHRIKSADVWDRGRRVTFYTFCLRLTQSKHTRTRLPEGQTILVTGIADQKFSIWAER